MSLFYIYDISNFLISWVYDIIANIICKIIYDIMELKL